jgi:tellurite resistance protein
MSEAAVDYSHLPGVDPAWAQEVFAGTRLVIEADGAITAEEKDLVDSLSYALALADETRPTWSLDELRGKLAGRGKVPDDVGRTMVHIATLASYIDGRQHPSELSVIRSLAEVFGVAGGVVDEIDRGVRRAILRAEVVERMEEVVAGSPAVTKLLDELKLGADDARAVARQLRGEMW